MALITCENVSLGYEGKTVTEQLSFSVQAGDYLCIVGENGSGKSTLMKALLHLKAPLGGSITMGEGLRADEIGYLPQQTMVQRDFPAAVREIVYSGLTGRSGWRPFFTKQEKQRAQRVMQRLNLLPLATRSYRALSGGQQQRVLLARALCATEKLLLLDEPVAGLDPVVTQELYDQIAALNREGITVIMVTHDLEAALSYASHILHVSYRPKFFGTAEAYLQSAVGEAYLQAKEGERA